METGNTTNDSQNLIALMSEYGEELQRDEDCKDQIVKSVHRVTVVQRHASALLQAVHHVADDSQGILLITDQVSSALANLPEIWDCLYQALNGKHPEAHRYSWRQVQSRLVTVVSFSHYLTHGNLISKSEAEIAIGVSSTMLKTIELDDFLLGICGLPNELSRFCVNLVTKGVYDRPHRISEFVSDLYSAFQVLNLKNDLLRKRYDGIKYDLQRIENVVYDLTIRHLKSDSATSR